MQSPTCIVALDIGETDNKQNQRIEHYAGSVALHRQRFMRNVDADRPIAQTGESSGKIFFETGDMTRERFSTKLRITAGSQVKFRTVSDQMINGSLICRRRAAGAKRFWSGEALAKRM